LLKSIGHLETQIHELKNDASKIVTNETTIRSIQGELLSIHEKLEGLQDELSFSRDEKKAIELIKHRLDELERKPKPGRQETSFPNSKVGPCFYLNTKKILI
jgi:chromosome segregation ATPase